MVTLISFSLACDLYGEKDHISVLFSDDWALNLLSVKKQDSLGKAPDSTLTPSVP